MQIKAETPPTPILLKQHHSKHFTSPTKIFYPTLLNSAYHFNHVSYKKKNPQTSQEELEANEKSARDH